MCCGYDMDKRLSRKDKKIWFTSDEGEKLELHLAFKKYPDQVMKYCKRDTESTHDLYVQLRKLLAERGWEQEWLTEHVPFTAVLVDMECAGIPIDLKSASKLKE